MSSERQSHATITTDLSYGDAGKGTTTEWLTHESYSAVVIRFNGGGQAEHNIVTPDGRHHVFSQFGAGSFLPEVATHLSRDMWVNPINMNFEGEHLEKLGVTDIWDRVTVDEDARIVTPFHRAGNRLRELARGAERHGSTGQGISEAVMDGMFRDDLTIRAGDIAKTGLVQRLEQLRVYKRDQFAALGQLLSWDTHEWGALNDPELSKWYAEIYYEWISKLRVVPRDHLSRLAIQYSHLIFEPAQGILLDEKRGFHPHTTWSNTTPDNAKRQLEDIQFSGDVKTYGIVRAYTTRHGFGPFVTEDASLDEPLHEYFNGAGPWQGKFRIGHFDAVAHRYAARAAGQLDGLVITGVDRYDRMPDWQYATRYQAPTGDATHFYELDDEGNVKDIRLSRFGDKSYMSDLTREMFRAQPIYEQIRNPSRDDIIETIEREMGMRAIIVSVGATVQDKIVCNEERELV